MEKTYNFPVFGTQGGGLVREIKTTEGYKYIFVEAPPQGMGLDVGDFMPEMWEIIPANKQAREVIEDEYTNPVTEWDSRLDWRFPEPGSLERDHIRKESWSERFSRRLGDN